MHKTILYRRINRCNPYLMMSFLTQKGLHFMRINSSFIKSQVGGLAERENTDSRRQFLQIPDQPVHILGGDREEIQGKTFHYILRGVDLQRGSRC